MAHFDGTIELSETQTEFPDSTFSILKKNDFAAAYSFAFNGYRLALESGNELEIIKWIRRMGNIEKLRGNYEESLRHYLEALHRNENLNNVIGIKKCHNELGSLYHYMKNYDKALEHFEKSLSMTEDDLIDAMYLGIKSNIAHIYRLQQEYDKALKHYQESQKAYLEIGMENMAFTLYGDIGKLYHAMGDYEKALEAHLKCLEYRKKRNNRYGLSGSHVEIGALYYDMGLTQKAIGYSEKGLQFARGLSNKEHMLVAYWTLYKAHEKEGQFEKALNNLAMYAALNDSVLNKEKVRLISELEVKYSVDQKVNEIQLLRQEKELQQLKWKQKNYTLYAVVSVFILLALTGFVVLRQKQFKLKQQSSSLQQKLLRSQMNPHFIFNSLIAIQSFIYKNNMAGASKFLAVFSKLVRLILENSKDELISFNKELQTLTHYLEMQHLRFTEDFEYNITIDPKINQDALKIPPMLTQPFIENAIEHGLGHGKEKEKIDVRFLLENDRLLLEIEDNGIGYYQGKLNSVNKVDTHKSLAMEITRDRIALFNQRNHQKIEFGIEELTTQNEEVQGTKVTFSIPLNLLK